MTLPLLTLEDRDGFIWMNGGLRPWREARTHALTHALHYGSAVFEGERSNQNGRIFKGPEHTARLFRSAALTGLVIPYEADVIERAKIELLRANNMKAAYIRVLAYRGPEQMGIYPGEHKVHVLIAAWDWGPYFKTREPLRLVTSRWRKADPVSVPVEAKASGNYLVNMMAKQEASLAGYGDALMLHLDGRVAEATGANIFFVDTSGTLLTPIAQGNFLNGITRQSVLEIAQKLGLPTQERAITADEFPNFRECFLTGTAAEIAPVGMIDGHRFPDSAAPGTVTQRLKTAYEQAFAAA